MRPTMTDTAKADVLRSVERFAGLSISEVELVAALASEHAVAPGAVLAREGRSANECIVVLAGEAAITVGGSQVAIGGPGSVVGDLESPDGTASPATVTALTLMHLLVVRTDSIPSGQSA